MKRQKRKLFLTERDRRLCEFLFRYKVATLKQVAKYPFKGTSYKATSLRLCRLIKEGYLKKKYLEEEKYGLFGYSLTNKVFPILEQRWDCEIHHQQTESENPVHDVTLVEIGERARKMFLVKEYLQENVLQGCKDLFPSSRYEVFSKIYSDAGLKVVIKEKPFYLALEYEAVLKSKTRIKDKLLEYSLQDDIRAVLYICKDVKIERALRKMEKETLTESEGIIYYIQLKDVLSKDAEWIFSNSEGTPFCLD